MAYINIKNINIYYERKGQGGTKILFLHGNSLSSRLFDKQFNDDDLLKSHELIRLDLPGFGMSGHAFDFTSYSMSGFASIIVEFYKRMGLAGSVLVGNSLGGHLILEAIDRLEGVKGIMINGTPPFAVPPADDLFLPNPAVGLFFQGQHTNDELESLANSMLYDSSNSEHLMAEIAKSDASFRNVWMTNFRLYPPKDEVEIVQNLQTPIAVVHGNEEKLVNINYLKKVPFKNLWQNEVILINKAAHLPFFEQPLVFNKYLIEFCKSVFSKHELQPTTAF